LVRETKKRSKKIGETLILAEKKTVVKNASHEGEKKKGRQKKPGEVYRSYVQGLARNQTSIIR